MYDVILGGMLGGVLGGFCVVAYYTIAVFCTGCVFGMSSLWPILVALFAASTNSASFVAALGLGLGMDRDTYNTLMVIDLLFGVFMGCVFVKFQKVCIMVGTSFVGSSWFWTGAFVLSHAPKLAPGSGVQTVLVYLSAAGSFCVQWFHTSKGVEIDPKTGKVVVITGQPVLPLGHEPPLLAAAQPTTAYIGASYK